MSVEAVAVVVGVPSPPMPMAIPGVRAGEAL